MPEMLKCNINYNKLVAPGVFLLGVMPRKKLRLQPGQFFMLRATESMDPLLGRPLSWFRYLPKKNLVEFVYQVVGRGTELLSQHRADEEITILGPLGKGFEPSKIAGRILLVAGGVGMPGIWSFCEQTANRKKCDLTLVWGAKTKHQFFMLREIPKWINFLPATEDGSFGKQGLATDLVLGLIAKEGPPARIFACGPRPMLKALAKIAAEHNIRGQALYEERMACGIGACLGCAVPGKNGGYLRACQDGPAFWFDEIDWERVK